MLAIMKPTEIRGLYNLVDRLQECQANVEHARQALHQAIAAVHESGHSYQQIAEVLGVTRARIQQIVQGVRKS